MTHTYLFVLSPPFCGSTVLWRLIRTSPNVAAFEAEGQHLPSVRDIMRPNRWDPTYAYPWADIRPKWEAVWDMNKPILLEKSPPHVLRAFSIQDAFPNATFVANMRNPYAFCEGYQRRTQKGMAMGAELWALCAEHQRRNVAELERVLFFSYEQFTEQPEQAAKQLLDFMPELGTLDPNASFAAHSVIGNESNKLQNMNAIKIELLTNEDVQEINSILQQHPDLMEHFGYDFIEPTGERGLKRTFAQGRLRFRKAFSRK